MNNSFKATRTYQFLYIFLIQLGASGVGFVFGLVAFWYFMNINIAKEIISFAFMASNFGMLYVAGNKISILDNKPYTRLKPSMVKAVLLGVFIAAINAIFVIIYKFLWIKYGTDAGIMGVLPTAFNAFFYYWTFPYNGFMNLDGGIFSMYSVAFMIVVPIAATVTGYIAGEKKFELAEKFDEFMYEKE